MKQSADLPRASSPVGAKLDSALAQKKRGGERGAGGSDGVPRDIAQKRMTEAMAEMNTANAFQSGTCDEHGGASAVLQAPSASDVDSAGSTGNRRSPLVEKTSGNGCDATGSCGQRSSGNSADGVGSDECSGAEVLEHDGDSATSRTMTPNKGNRRNENRQT